LKPGRSKRFFSSARPAVGAYSIPGFFSRGKEAPPKHTHTHKELTSTF